MKTIFHYLRKEIKLTYEERLKSMGLVPFTRNGFLAHADWQNESRRNAIEEIDKYEIINTYKVKDWMALKLFKNNGEVSYPVDPVLIVAKHDNTLYVFNGHYTYQYNMNNYLKYEIFNSGIREIIEEDGEEK